MKSTASGSLPPAAANTTAIILCGGAGRRAGGADKPLFEFDGHPLIGHVAASVEPLAARILISANRNHTVYGQYGEVIADEDTDFPGPLAGVAACLKRTNTPFALVCAGDAPRVKARLWQRLLAALFTSEVTAVCAHDGIRRQPLFLALDCRRSPDLGSELEHYFSRGQRSVLGWLEQIGALDVDCRDLAAQFTDVDNLSDLQTLQANTRHSSED